MSGLPPSHDEIRAAAMRVSKAVRTLAASRMGWMYKTPENRELGLASLHLRYAVEGDYPVKTA